MATIKETITNILEIIMRNEELHSQLSRFDVSRLAAMFSYREQDIEEGLEILLGMEENTFELEEEIKKLAAFLDFDDEEGDSDFEGYVIIVAGAL